ncbi:MAG: tyrosine-protein phosphatase [Acidimicrobiales bacterium]
MTRTAQPERHIDLEGCFNFRDLGGYVGAGGRTVSWQRLFRSDGLHRLTPVDLERLADLGLRTVIDLRTPDEVERRGRIEWPAGDLAYHHLPMIDVLPPSEEMPSWISPDFVAAQYRQMLQRGEPSIRQALLLLADPAKQPAVVHCMAGKDRTGILSALVLGLLGVSDDDIVADYTLSSAAMVKLLAWMREANPELANDIDQASAAVIAAEPAAMAGFLAGFREDHESFEAYAQRIGVASAADALRANLLES